MDMMLSTPISFEADAQLLSNLENMKGTIQVDFEDKGDRLKALEVRQCVKLLPSWVKVPLRMIEASVHYPAQMLTGSKPET